LRQLGCATGVAVMTTLLQARLEGASVLAAYTGCFQMMAIMTAMTLPGILLFRLLQPSTAPTAAA
jgi:hypothetical protein